MYPAMAIAASPNAWYAWVSPELVDFDGSRNDNAACKTLIPLGGCKERVVVGHYVGYDRYILIPC
jgi:DNA polymerase gamma 1